jgi:hypothetical protein
MRSTFLRQTSSGRLEEKEEKGDKFDIKNFLVFSAMPKVMPKVILTSKSTFFERASLYFLEGRDPCDVLVRFLKRGQTERDC